MRCFLLGLMVVGACARPSAATRHPAWVRDPAAWPALRDRLAGTWHGTTDDGAAVDVTYQPIAGDSALAETFGAPTRATMTLYHPDHGGLVATHYCAQGNQPRLRAVSVDANQVRFAVADVTDLDRDEAHLVSLAFEFTPDRFDRIEDYQASDGSIERTRWHFTRATAP